MIVETIERISPLIPLERVFIVLGGHLKETLRGLLPELPEENILVEPEGRNTAPCLAFAVAVTSHLFGDPIMAVLTADHHIPDVESYRLNVESALRMADSEPVLVTIGIPAERPETGFGYLEAGELLSDTPGGVTYRVIRFHEKPDRKTAGEYIRRGNFYWNSGMFFWRNSTFLEQARRHAPELAEAVIEFQSAWGTEDQDERIYRIYRSLPKTSIDYALMEKADKVFMIKADFRWEDVGTWEALAKIRPAEPETGNVTVGECHLIETRNTIVFNQPIYSISPSPPLIVAMGVRDLIIVNTGDAILICPRERCQDLRNVVAYLRERNLDRYL